MAKKKRKSLLGKLLGVIALCISLYMLVTVGKNVLLNIELKKQKQAVEVELEALKEENESLNSTKTKLEDPEYIQTYARGELMLSKADEKVYYLPGKSK